MAQRRVRGSDGFFGQVRATLADIAALDHCVCGHCRGRHPETVNWWRRIFGFPCLACECKGFRVTGPSARQLAQQLHANTKKEAVA